MSEFQTKRRITDGPRPESPVEQPMKDPTSLIENILSGMDDFPASVQRDILLEIKDRLIGQYAERAMEHHSIAKELDENVSILKNAD